MTERKTLMPFVFGSLALTSITLFGFVVGEIREQSKSAPSEYNEGTVTLDLAQWQCRQAETVLTLVDDKLMPVGQCTRYERIISED